MNLTPFSLEPEPVSPRPVPHPPPRVAGARPMSAHGRFRSSDPAVRRCTARPPRPGAGIGILGVVIILPMLLALTGCGTTRIRPPPTPVDPVPVYLLDHGRHTSLVLPTADGGTARYAFGEWRWYALGETGPLRALDALLRPTQSALGRRRMPGPATESAVRSQVRVLIEQLHTFEVDAARAEALRQRLDRHFEGVEIFEVPAVDLGFVPHPLPYTIRDNSNALIADWLTELGAEVSGRPVIANWRVIERQARPPEPRR